MRFAPTHRQPLSFTTVLSSELGKLRFHLSRRRDKNHPYRPHSALEVSENAVREDHEIPTPNLFNVFEILGHTRSAVQWLPALYSRTFAAGAIPTRYDAIQGFADNGIVGGLHNRC